MLEEVLGLYEGEVRSRYDVRVLDRFAGYVAQLSLRSTLAQM
jgi:hypothetical protein